MQEETGHKRFHFPIGMRIVKTVIAAFLCMVIDYLRGEIPFQSVTTTALCIQPDRKESVNRAFSRALGTVVGAILGLVVFVLFEKPLTNIHTLLYYFVIALFMIPLIFLVSKLRIPNGTLVSIVVYISITLVQGSTMNSSLYALNRMIDTMVGIFVALPVNILLPQKKEITTDTSI